MLPLQHKEVLLKHVSTTKDGKLFWEASSQSCQTSRLKILLLAISQVDER